MSCCSSGLYLGQNNKRLVSMYHYNRGPYKNSDNLASESVWLGTSAGLEMTNLCGTCAYTRASSCVHMINTYYREQVKCAILCIQIQEYLYPDTSIQVHVH